MTLKPMSRRECLRAGAAAAGLPALLHVSANPPSPFHIDIYRMGYYRGAGARHMLRLGPFAGRPQPDPPVGPERVRECRWEPSARLAIPGDWPSGVYLGKLAAEKDGRQSYVIFVVRDDRPADFLFQCSTNTWQAYNRWPGQVALYDDGRSPEMFANVERAVAAGTHAAFLSGNTALGITPFGDGPDGAPRRTAPSPGPGSSPRRSRAS